MQDFVADFRHGVRLLVHSPGFTAVAVLSLAVGIGANTAVFSVINTVVLRSLPVERPDELVELLFKVSRRSSSELLLVEALRTLPRSESGVLRSDCRLAGPLASGGRGDSTGNRHGHVRRWKVLRRSGCEALSATGLRRTYSRL
jgi:hypothetical protein